MNAQDIKTLKSLENAPINNSLPHPVFLKRFSDAGLFDIDPNAGRLVLTDKGRAAVEVTA